MKRIIDISEEDYKRFISYKSNKYAPTIHQVDTLMLAVANSTPLNECEAEGCRSLRDIKEMLERKANALDGVPISDGGGACIGIYFSIANDIPPVYPKSEEYSWCKGCKEYDQENHCCYRYSKVIRNTLAENIKAELEDIKAEISDMYPNYADEKGYRMIRKSDVLNILDEYISGKENG